MAFQFPLQQNAENKGKSPPNQAVHLQLTQKSGSLMTVIILCNQANFCLFCFILLRQDFKVQAWLAWDSQRSACLCSQLKVYATMSDSIVGSIRRVTYIKRFRHILFNGWIMCYDSSHLMQSQVSLYQCLHICILIPFHISFVFVVFEPFKKDTSECFGLHICMCTMCMSGVHECQKRALGPLEL